MRKSNNIKSKRDRTKCSTDNNKQRVEEQGELVGSTSNLPGCSGHNLTENLTVSNPNHGASRGGPAPAAPGIALHSAGKARAQLPPDEGDGVRVRTRRYPHCSRCRSHGMLVPIKGHKKFCDWKNCKCHNCQLITARQKLMAKVIALHRQQDMEAMANLQQLATASHSVAGDEVPDLGVTIVSPHNSVPPSHNLSSLPPGSLVTNNQGIPQTHSLQVGPHSSIQYQWNGNNSTHYSPVIDNEIHTPVGQSSETDFPSSIYGTSLASHGRSGGLGPMMAYTPYSKCSHQQLPFPFGMVSTPGPKLSTATSQIYSPNFLFYHQQHQQQQQQLQVQMPQYRFQGNSFGACVGDGQGAFVPVGQPNLATHHSVLSPEDSPSPSEMTSADAFDEVAVLEVEASEIQESANHTFRIPVSSRTMQQAFLPASSKDISTMSDFHSLLGPPSTATEPRAFIPLQNALFPHRHSQDKN